MDDFGNSLFYVPQGYDFWDALHDWLHDGLRFDGYIVDRFYGEQV